MDPIRRNILATGAAAAATAAAPHVFAQQADQGGAFKFYEKGNVRIRYQEVGTGFPFLVTPGGGLNSRISNWRTAVINAMEEFKNDFRCITMDQRNASGFDRPLRGLPMARIIVNEGSHVRRRGTFRKHDSQFFTT